MDKIVCVGKNYLEHAKELGDGIPEKPVIFLKPPSVLRTAARGETVEATLPANAGSVHHEVEIVIKLGKGGFRLSPKEAEGILSEVTLGLDMTLRDRQAQLKKSGHPWTTAKVFPDSAIVGPWKDISTFPSYLIEPFSFSIDGVLRQTGKGAQMSFKPAECVSYISEFFPLVAGDIIFTGTPAGVGPVTSGQRGMLTWGDLSYSVVWKA